MPNDKNRNHERVYDIDPSELTRRKRRFRNSELLCNSPVVTYMDYVTRAKASSEDSPSGKDTTAKRHRPKRDFSKFEDKLKHINKANLRKVLDTYLLEIGTNTTQVEKQFEKHEHFGFRREEIYALFEIESNENADIQAEEDWIRNHIFMLWLPKFCDHLNGTLGERIWLSEKSKESAIFELNDICATIQKRLETDSTDTHANEIPLYLMFYHSVASEIVERATQMLSDEQLRVFVDKFNLSLDELVLPEDQEAVAALLLESPRKAMHYFGSYLLFRGYHELEFVREKVNITTNQIVIPDEIMRENLTEELLEDSRGINSPLYNRLDKERLEITRDFIESYMGEKLLLLEGNVIDVLSAYNFLFSGKDQLKFRNRSNRDKGYKLYCVQNYVLRYLELEHEVNKRETLTKKEQKQLKSEYKIESNEEFLAAMKVFSIYRECVLECLWGEDEREHLAAEMRLRTIVSVGQSVLRYNALETISVNTDFLVNCLSVLFDLYHYGETRPINTD